MTDKRPPFIHLKVHTAYSICEGAVKINNLTKSCVEMRLPACAITDTNNMFGVLDFAIQCSAKGIQPIIGCTLDIIFNDITAPIVVIAKNENGYKNLLKLMTCFYNSPPVTLKNLEEHSSGIIALSGGHRGPAGKLLLQNSNVIATEFLDSLSSIYKDNFYIEISRQYLPDERRTEPFFVEYAMKKNIPLVATNEVFFLTKNKHEAQEVLMCIGDGTYITQADRRKVSEHAYLKNSDEMYELFSDIPEAVINTSVIAMRCSYMPEEHSPMLPRFDDGSGDSEETILERQAKEGLQKRINEEVLLYKSNAGISKEEIESKYMDRLEYEYTVIKKMGFCGYFLIVSDFVKWSKQNDIPVGPGRGSGAGSLISWTLYITDLDPINYGLIFERFLNPDRVSMPDFDIDFCQNRRDEVISYVQEKYGKDKVAHIIALGKLQARAVIRDVGRVIQMPYGKVDKISKLVPNNPANPVDLERALEIEPQLLNMAEEDESVNFLINTGLELEGLYRHLSVHAAGIVIGQRSIDEMVPIYNDGESEMAITQFNMKFVEKAGLVKFDFLGLKTLTMIKQACDLVGLNISKIPLDDEKTFKLLQDVNVMGVFQLESTGMQDVIQKLKPDRFEDIIALVSLYRPGPMDDIPKYLARKHGSEPIVYLHPCLEDILSSTYGVMVYQEQVMKIAQVMGGYTLAASDLLRRAMGKKIVEEMASNKKIFVDGAKAKGINGDVAASVFTSMAKFAGYGFNRSHAAPYALISYQTAYIKANYMHEFYVAAMNLDIDNTDKIAMFVQDAKKNNITILPPDVNKSDSEFKREGDCIRYALAAMKGSSAISARELVKERDTNGKFKDIHDFFKRVTKKYVNKRQVEGLVMSGAFDCLHKNRNQVYEYYNKNSGQDHSHAGAKVIQKSLFGSSQNDRNEIPDVQEWNVIEKLERERSTIGFYLSAHPMDVYSDFLGSFKITRSRDFDSQSGSSSSAVTVAGILLSKQEKLSKNKQKYAFLNISDQDNAFEVSIMPAVYQQVSDSLKVGKAVIMDVSIKSVDGIRRIVANSLQDINAIFARQRVYLEISDGADIDKLQQIIENIEDGNNPISFIIKASESKKTEIETKYKKNLNIENRRKLTQVEGVKFYEAIRSNNSR